MAQITVSRPAPEQITPPRLRIAVGHKSGAGRLVMDPPLSPADVAAHRAASYVRPARPAVA
ncbi:hypothetical protein [Streptomyces racemochromogenes]|uniref:hypothetical protein n=1 Tax=Streptomyces racemochromogenes TaxID=67353 RepID=UPI0031EA858C